MNNVNITIHHNPDCGTSRDTRALILDSGVESVVVAYLKTPRGRAPPLGVRLCRLSEAALDILPSPQLAPFTKASGEPVIEARGRHVAS